jgi:hypothetical protein
MSAGQLNQIIIGLESSWGVAVTPAKAIPVDFTGGIQQEMNVQKVSPLRATLAQDYDAFFGKKMYQGDLEMELFNDYPGYMLYGALGSIVSALKSGETIVYQHTITEQAAKPSFTIEQAIGENVRRFAGCFVKTIKIKGKAGDVVTLTAHVVGKSQATATKVTPAYTTVRPYNWADVALKIGGVQLNEVENFEFEYDNQIEVLHTLAASNDPQFNYVKGSIVKGKIECYMDSTTMTEYNKYLSKTSSALDLVLTGDPIGTASNASIAINVPKVFYTKAETPIKNDYNLVTIEFEGFYDPTTSKLLSCVITNLLTAYN